MLYQRTMGLALTMYFTVAYDSALNVRARVPEFRVTQIFRATRWRSL